MRGKRTRHLLLGLTLVLSVLAHERASADSLNVRLVGGWPFSGLQAVIGDAGRNLCFVGSGGGVYVLDISNPSAPETLSLAVRTKKLGTATICRQSVGVW